MTEKFLGYTERLCAGEVEAGPMAVMSQSERFHWLTSPRSAMIQVSPMRTGVSAEPEVTLAWLAEEMVGYPIKGM